MSKFLRYERLELVTLQNSNFSQMSPDAPDVSEKFSNQDPTLDADALQDAESDHLLSNGNYEIILEESGHNFQYVIVFPMEKSEDDTKFRQKKIAKEYINRMVEVGLILHM